MGWEYANTDLIIFGLLCFAIGAIVSPTLIWLYIIRGLLRASWIDTVEITGEAIKEYARKKRS